MSASSRFVVVALLSCACNRSDTPKTVAPEPSAEPVDAAEPEPEPPFEQNTFVSTSHNEERKAGTLAAEPEPSVQERHADFAVTSAEQVKELAQAAVADQLDETKTWKQSPLLPATWPAKESEVAIYFYPMSANAGSLTEYQLYSAAFRVTVSLGDGTTSITPLGKRRKLGTVKETRPSSLERRELELAESAMVEQLMGTNPEAGTKPYWGYLKYVHEHTTLGKDLERREAAFFRWVRQRHGG